MPSTRISICVICARVSGTAKEPNRTSSARYFLFIAPPSSKPKLLGNSKTNVAANGHKQCTSGMRDVPIHPEPDVHSRSYAHIACDSGQQNVTAASTLGNSCDAVILRTQPREHRTNEPFTGNVFRFVGPVREPETRFDVTSQACCLCAVRAQQGMEIFISYQAFQVEETGIAPIRCQE